MYFRILGPLEVRDGDRELELGGDKQRALLAVLLLHAGEVVSADRLIDDLWGERPPPGAPKALQAHVSRLRKALNENREVSLDGDRLPGQSAAVLVTRGHGYLLRVEPDELDVDSFRRLCQQGSRALTAAQPEEATRLLGEGLALWRGPPLADFAYAGFAQEPIAELEELYLGAVEDRADAELALGHHEHLIGELTALVRRNPLRERLRAELMIALYRSGRQADALALYQEFRRSLSEQLGLDPGPRLQQLEAAILRRDSSLDPPSGSPHSEPRTSAGAPTVSSRHRPWRGLPLAGVALVAAAVTAGVLVGVGGAGAARSVIAADAVGEISASSGVLGPVVPVGSSPSGVAAGAGAVWVANYNDGTVSRIDAATHSVQTIPVGSTPSGIAVGAGAVWVANSFGGTVSWINPKVNRVVMTIPVGNGPSAVAVGAGSIWVTNRSDGTLSRVDAVTGRARAPIPLGGSLAGVGVGLGGVWVSDAADRQVMRVDATTGQLMQTIGVGTGPSAIVIGYGSVWVANSLDGTVSRINPQTNQVAATIPVGNTPNALAVGAGGVWVADEFGGALVRIDPATDSVVRTVAVGNSPRGVVVAGSSVWVSAQATAASHRGGTLTALTSLPFDTDDPAAWNGSVASALTFDMTNDGLTAFKRVGGSDGAQVVPDLAISLPTPTDGGRTYAFRLRRGIRYSNGQLVRPEDFRWGIERGFKLRAFADETYYKLIVGGADCVARPSRCDLSRGIVTDDAADSVTFHLAAPDPEFLQRLALMWAFAVPVGTPIENTNRRFVNLPTPLPATGPYEIASYSPAHEVRLVRNPYFREWSHAARPDGYPDQIVWRIGASPSAAVTAVEQDRADYTVDSPPPDRLVEVQTRFAGQLKANPNDITAVLFLNTHTPPFNDLRVRRALNYAVDRRRVAGLIGQASQPTCQLLPPFVPGYERYCPFTLGPNRSGAWNAPDLARARALIGASHTRGTKVTIWSQPSLGIDYTAAGRYLASLLDRLGYRSQLTSSSALAPDTPDWWRQGQAAFQTAAPGYPAASEFIHAYLACQYLPRSSSSFSLNISEFCSLGPEATMRQAFAAEAANSPVAADLWARADRQVTDDAPLVPLVTPWTLDFVARRVGNYQYHPQQGILIDQLWVR